MWIESKDLLKGFNRFCTDPENTQTFDSFFELLKANLYYIKDPLFNKPKDLSNRGTIKKAAEDGQMVELVDVANIQLDKGFCDDILLISDQYNLDEFEALELVITGEKTKMRKYRGLSRHHCAIFCFYEAQRNYSLLLKSLLAFRSNNLLVNGPNSQKLRNLTEELLCDKEFFPRLFDKFLAYSVDAELKKLAISSSVMGESHQEIVRLVLKDLGSNLYQIICLSSLYCPIEMQRDVLQKLLQFLKGLNPQKSVFSLQQLTAWTACLLFINPVRLKQQCDGSTESIILFKELLDESGQWNHRCLKATLDFCFGVGIKYARNSLGLSVPHEYDEYEFVDEGIKNMAIEFLQTFIVKIPSFSECQFSVDVMDCLIKNFICYFKEKLAEMFNLCEEELFSIDESVATGQAEHQKSVFSDNLHFKELIELIANLYEADTPQIINYSREFTDPKCEGLCEFVESGKSITAPSLSVSYLSMLRSICKNKHSANIFFNLFK